MTEEIGTLKELGVKPGDVVECVWDYVNTWTEGCRYEMTHRGLSADKPPEQLSSISTFRLISRASDTPKIWGEMTDEERGALLLAEHEGKVIEKSPNQYNPIWADKGSSSFVYWCAYRVKPEPVRETVTLHYGVWGYASAEGHEGATHRITFDLIDGKPDCASIKMEEI